MGYIISRLNEREDNMKNMMKAMVIVLTVLVLFSMVVSCATYAPYEHRQNLLSRMTSPITVISVGPDAVLLKDARGNFYTIEGREFASLKAGDMINKY
jgi:hypothetical protein